MVSSFPFYTLTRYPLPLAVQALYKFDATDPTDLALSPGHLIDVPQVDAGEWGMGISRATGKAGAFPWTYVENTQHNCSQTITIHAA